MPRLDRTWVAALNAEEQSALQQSELFFERPDGRWKKAVSSVGKPLSRLLEASPERVHKTVSNALHGVLSTVAAGAEAGSSQDWLTDELCRRSGRELEPWERIFEIDFGLLEQTADRQLTRAKTAATLQGGVLGLTGAPGILADIPALYYLMFRMVNQIALCLGHPASTTSERLYLMKVVNTGHHLEQRERRLALLELDHLEHESQADQSAEDVQRTLLAKTVQHLSKTLAATLVQRKSAQMVAFVGGAMGAVLNRQLIEDVGLTAKHAYRRRFLRKVALRRIAERASF